MKEDGDMKIIQVGNKEVLLKIKRFCCNTCGCVFEATKDEYETYTQYNQESYSCICPTCKNNVYCQN